MCNSFFKQNKQRDVKKTEFLETLEDVAVNPEDGCKVLKVCTTRFVYRFSKKLNISFSILIYLYDLCVGELPKVQHVTTGDRISPANSIYKLNAWLQRISTSTWIRNVKCSWYINKSNNTL